MIEKINAYRVGDKPFMSLAEAQAAELLELFGKELFGKETTVGAVGISWDQVAVRLVEEKEKVVDILTTGPRSKPKARKINGAKKSRLPKTDAPKLDT